MSQVKRQVRLQSTIANDVTADSGATNDKPAH